MGEPPMGATIERIDNDGPYSAANCRWATYQENLNNKRDNRVLAFNGKRQTLMQWSRDLGIEYHTLRGRLRRGWPVERVLTEPAPHKD